ncbi:MAG: lytic transglycosylase domain-containing protein [Deltaproteobacteria bacterium]|nr:lytic transglycosylase domain-containing protein [Deltaproteobacteria bacterium]
MAPTHAQARTDYLNFDPQGRFGLLEREAELAAARASAENERMDREMLMQIVLTAAAQVGIDPALLVAMAIAESRFDPYAVSPMGAQGLMQLMPATGRRFGCTDPFDPYQNARGGARYMLFLLERYAGNTRLAIAAYNSGPAPVDRLGDVPPIPETQAYVERVLRYMDEVRLELP